MAELKPPRSGLKRPHWDILRMMFDFELFRTRWRSTVDRQDRQRVRPFYMNLIPVAGRGGGGVFLATKSDVAPITHKVPHRYLENP